MWMLGLSALSGIFVLERQVDARSDAQVVTAVLQREVDALSPMAFNSDQGFSQRQVRAQLNAAARQIGRDAVRLGQLSGDRRDTTLILSSVLPMLAVLQRANVLASTGHAAAAGALMGRAASPGAPEFTLNRLFARFSTEFDHQAAHARLLAELGSLLAIVSVLLAFSLALHRASSLAREKHRETLIDPLTGLANRRKLFVDMKALLSSEREPRETLALGMFDLDGFKMYNDTFGHPAGDALLTRLGQSLLTAIGNNATAYRMGGDEFCVIAHGPGAETTLVNAQAALSETSDRFTVACSAGSIAIVPDQTTLEEALSQADQRLYNNKRSSRQGGEARDVLLGVLAETSLPLGTHLSNVGRLAVAVARKLGLSDEETTLTRLTAELHDIGKTAIPDSILDKPGPLDPDERLFIRRHTIIGERILAAAPALARVAPLVRATHERPDGQGYPDGLHGDQIPLTSRIVAVVDAYDAMTSKRAYSLPLSPEQAIDELRRCAGTQFDPMVAEAFIAIWHERITDTPTVSPSDRPNVAA